MGYKGRISKKLYVDVSTEAASGYSYGDIIGSGPEIQKVFQLLSQVAAADSTVLILGETGTGKRTPYRA